MNREIKFRAWIEKHSKMIEVWQLNYEGFTNEKLQSIASSIVINENYVFKTDDVVLMQYTGLKDKNGVEIYEGDIVKDEFGRIMRVGFWNYRLCWISISETNFHHADFYDWIVGEERTDNDTFPPVRTETEIIGNVYQHPNPIS